MTTASRTLPSGWSGWWSRTAWRVRPGWDPRRLSLQALYERKDSSSPIPIGPGHGRVRLDPGSGRVDRDRGVDRDGWSADQPVLADLDHDVPEPRRLLT